MAAPKQGILSLTIRDKSALYAAYMPFIKNGGLFIRVSVVRFRPWPPNISATYLSNSPKYQSVMRIVPVRRRIVVSDRFRYSPVSEGGL